MATKTAITKLPEVLRSPSTAQYAPYKHQGKHSSPYFKPRFTFKLEDRKHSFLYHRGMSMTDPLMPPYPHGENNHFPEANFGLYGGASIRSGNKISKGRNKGKTVRHWFPNVRIETVRSEALDRELKLPITARVMRTIRKCGGLDEYVTGAKPARIKELGLLGWKLRWLVMTSKTYQAKHAMEMMRHDLPGHYSLESTFEKAWNDEGVRTKMVEQQDAAWNDLREAAKRFEMHVRKAWVDSGEKGSYGIHRLASLNQSSPSSIGLPEQLEESYEQFAKFTGKAKSKANANSNKVGPNEMAPMHTGTYENTLASTEISATSSLSGSIEDQIHEAMTRMKAQDIGIHPSRDDEQRRQRKIEAAKDKLTISRNRVLEVDDEQSRTRAERETDETAAVAIAQNAEDHVAKVDRKHVEKHAEQHLEAIRREMKKDDQAGWRQ